jgi:hypothetical protein
MKLPRYTKYLIATSCLASLILGNAALGGEIFHWVDDNGISHFSDWAPKDSNVEVTKLIVSDANPPGYDPNEDQNSILGQAERMNERWSELRERQDERRKQRLELEEQQRRQYAVEYDYPYYDDSYFYYRPGYRPIHRPGFGHRPPFRIQRRQVAALDQLGLTGMRPHSINSSAHLARINATQSLNSGFQARPPGKMHHASAYKEW